MSASCWVYILTPATGSLKSLGLMCTLGLEVRMGGLALVGICVGERGETVRWLTCRRLEKIGKGIDNSCPKWG